MSHRTVTATEFKAKCLALLDEVNESGETLTITKRGKAVATVNGFRKAPFKSMRITTFLLPSTSKTVVVFEIQIPLRHQHRRISRQ